MSRPVIWIVSSLSSHTGHSFCFTICYPVTAAEPNTYTTDGLKLCWIQLTNSSHALVLICYLNLSALGGSRSNFGCGSGLAFVPGVLSFAAGSLGLAGSLESRCSLESPCQCAQSHSESGGHANVYISLVKLKITLAFGGVASYLKAGVCLVHRSLPGAVTCSQRSSNRGDFLLPLKVWDTRAHAFLSAVHKIADSGIRSVSGLAFNAL